MFKRMCKDNEEAYENKKWGLKRIPISILIIQSY